MEIRKISSLIVSFFVASLASIYDNIVVKVADASVFLAFPGNEASASGLLTAALLLEGRQGCRFTKRLSHSARSRSK
jgi:hypothetical protein